ncbi:MAG TPA: type I 3-dehydroquinate dehydratase [Negativicutes bacterium]|nr:type I 3-dehydroquinate dehydratase [Negativicutes bacterium]
MKGKTIGEGKRPLICTPLVGKTRAMIMDELEKILVKSPDVIEWRADYFEAIANSNQVVDMANEIKKTADGLTIIFTVRSAREGGQPISLSDDEVLALNAEICTRTDIDYIDCELSQVAADIFNLRDIAHENGTKIIASFHHFEFTPSFNFLYEKFSQAERFGLDVAKIAVMSRRLEDVLALLSVTLEARKKLKIPLIAVSMGQYGAITRILDATFGSSLTFAVGHHSSAPGQVPIEDIRTMLQIIEKSMGPTVG